MRDGSFVHKRKKMMLRLLTMTARSPSFASTKAARIAPIALPAYHHLSITIFFAVLLFIAFLPTQAHAGFGNDTGKVLVPTEIGSSISESTQSIARQIDGKLVIGGQCFLPNIGGGFCVARLNIDGSPDTTFNGGLASPAIPGKVSNSVLNQVLDRLFSIAIDGNGKIVAAGSCRASSSTPVSFCLIRLNSNGSLDTTFNAAGTNGAAVGRVAFTFATSAINSDGFGGIAIQPITNKIVIVGGCSGRQCIARLNENGDFDSGFASAASTEGVGRLSFRITDEPEQTNAVVIEPTGKIIVAASCAKDVLNLVQSVCLTKFNESGSLDTSFTGGVGGAGGFRIQAFTSGGASVRLLDENPVALALDGGKLNLLCRHDSLGPKACIYRFNASNGTLDTSFAASEPTPGKLIFQIQDTGNFLASAMSIDPSSTGRLVAVGGCAFTTADATDRYCVARITNTGALDSTFSGPNVNATTGFSYRPSGGGDLPYAVNVDAIGNVFVGGDCNTNMCVAGFDPSGALNSSPCAANVDASSAILATTDGMLIVRSMLNLPGTLAGPRGLGYDVDGDGAVDASRDGIIFLRAMLGFKDASINVGISVPPSVNRKTWTDIRSYLNTRCGMSLAQ